MHGDGEHEKSTGNIAEVQEKSLGGASDRWREYGVFRDPVEGDHEC